MLVGDHKCMAAVQEASGMRGWGWAAVRASEERQDCGVSVTDSFGDLGGVAFLCPRLTFLSVKWVFQRGRVISLVLPEGIPAGQCAD